MGQNKQLIKANLLKSALWADSNRIFLLQDFEAKQYGTASQHFGQGKINLASE
ncbi:hypothetical protein EJG51_003875 [Undibacterium piscinae]|jgi:hypothetical protein|uniref:Uncharacterized protein n=1 Tax=Undibacterium piscinae TaxID=2495591 RepID=A0A6M4A2Y2_9BURK|nr:hypothetical protein EJG51_003875 [Undibacterium piscinae]